MAQSDRNESPATSLERWQNAAMINPQQERMIVSALKGYATRIAALIGDPDIDVNQLMASVVLAVAKNDYLLKCDPTSLILAVLQGAREGIRSFSGPFAGGYLVPFKSAVTLIHNYKFLLDVALESGAIQGITFGVVRKGDEFDYEDGTKSFLRYKKLLKGERGELVCSWAVVTLPSGSQRIDVLEFDYLSRIREDSLAKITREDAKQFSPWVQWPDEMIVKTQIRHALKTCGLNFDRHQRLVNLMENDDRAMVGDVAKEFAGIPLTPDAPAQRQQPNAAASVRHLAEQARQARERAGGQATTRPGNGDPLAPLMDELEQLTDGAAILAVQKRWLDTAEESLHGDIKALVSARLNVIQQTTGGS